MYVQFTMCGSLFFAQGKTLLKEKLAKSSRTSENAMQMFEAPQLTAKSDQIKELDNISEETANSVDVKKNIKAEVRSTDVLKQKAEKVKKKSAARDKEDGNPPRVVTSHGDTPIVKDAGQVGEYIISSR